MLLSRALRAFCMRSYVIEFESWFFCSRRRCHVICTTYSAKTLSLEYMAVMMHDAFSYVNAGSSVCNIVCVVDKVVIEQFTENLLDQTLLDITNSPHMHRRLSVHTPETCSLTMHLDFWWWNQSFSAIQPVKTEFMANFKETSDTLVSTDVVIWRWVNFSCTYLPLNCLWEALSINLPSLSLSARTLKML